MQKLYQRFLEEYGKSSTDIEFQELNGLPIPQVVKLLKVKHSLPGHLNSLIFKYNKLIDAVYVDVKPHESCVELIKLAVAKQFTIAIVTSNEKLRVCRWLEHNELSLYFYSVVGAKESPRAKPHPDPYLTALTVSKCDVKASFAIEDSYLGATSALSAGLQTYGYSPKPNTVIWPNGLIPVTDFLQIDAYL